MRPRTVLTLSVGCLAAACQLVAGIDDRSVYVEPPPEAVVDASVTPDAAPDPCLASWLRPAPSSATSSPTDAIEGVLALSKLRLDTAADSGVAEGMNLDRTCTCPGHDSCQRPAGPNAQALPPACDGPRGVDNAARGLFAVLAQGKVSSEAAINDSIAKGSAGLVIRIRRYNGLPDDAQVDVAVYASQGFSGAGDAGPAFDGGDPWSIDQASVLNYWAETPRYVTTNAYVSGGTLVATLQLPVIVGWSSGQPIIVELEGGQIQAKITMAGAKISGLRGKLGGRWRVDKLLTALQLVPDPLDSSKRLCGDNPTFVALKSTFCSAADIASNPSDDGVGVCDAVSLGLGFEASAAVIGPVRLTPYNGAPCGINYAPRCP